MVQCQPLKPDQRPGCENALYLVFLPGRVTAREVASRPEQVVYPSFRGQPTGIGSTFLLVVPCFPCEVDTVPCLIEQQVYSVVRYTR
jgi:hypothetical protein